MGIISWFKTQKYYSDREQDYVRLAPLLAGEARAFIKRIQESSAIRDLYQLVFQKNEPEHFTVYSDRITWKNDCSGQLNTVLFSQLSLPNLSYKRPFSKEIDWQWRFGFYPNEFWNTYPDVYGLSKYDSSLDSDGFEWHPCINECYVVGIALCKYAGLKYSASPVITVGDTPAREITFSRKDAITHTRGW